MKALYDPQDVIRANHPIAPLKPAATIAERPKLRRLPRPATSPVTAEES